MKKKETLVNDIIGLYDYIDELERKIHDMEISKAIVDGDTKTLIDDSLSPLSTVCLCYGRERMFDSIFSDYSLPSKMVNGKKLKSFDDFLDSITWNEIHTYSSSQYDKDIINNYSIKEIVAFFKTELRHEYDEYKVKFEKELLENAK